MLELTIRPFQRKQIAPAVLILDDTKQDDPISQDIGSAGGTTFDFSYSFSGSAKSSGGDDWKETSRKSETKRVANPDDESQFVDIKRATQVNFNNTKDSKQKRSYNFTYPDSNSA